MDAPSAGSAGAAYNGQMGDGSACFVGSTNRMLLANA